MCDTFSLFSTTPDGVKIPTLSDWKGSGILWYERWYKITKASIGQLIYAISFVAINKKNKTPYEEYLSEWFNEEIPKLIFEYEKILGMHIITGNTFDYTVRSFNLAGNLPHSMELMSDKHQGIKVGYAKLGTLIEAAQQRVDFIINREIPVPYKVREELTDAFIRMQTEMQTFKELLNDFEEGFVNAVDRAQYVQREKERTCRMKTGRN